MRPLGASMIAGQKPQVSSVFAVDSNGQHGDGLGADDEIVDHLPADLDLDQLDSDYTIPNNNRRRIPALLYVVLGSLAAAWYLVGGEDSPLVNRGTLVAAICLIGFAVYGFFASGTLVVDEVQALSTSASVLDFAIGHASAQMVWRGWLSRPVWRVLCYSSDNPPTRRALVLIDGRSGKVIEWFAEANPEEWSVVG